ncbi:hypothetical protein CsSME_00037427 [Camellia sinensis var. sinensis]
MLIYLLNELSKAKPNLGSGWQHIGAYVNLGAFYLCGIPIAAILAFWVQLRGKGLWIGIQAGAFVQTIMLAIITRSTNWDKQEMMIENLGC